MNIEEMATNAKKAASEMAGASSEQKNTVLKRVMENLQKHKEAILEANQRDLALASGLSAPLLERLSLEGRLEGIIHDIAEVINLPDPVGVLSDEKELSNKLHILKCTTPIGVLAAIYESRPNVTIDISMLAIKSGNAVILRGGSETLHTNQILVELIQRSLASANLPKEAVQLVIDVDRERVRELLQLHEYIDLVIPRGGALLQQFCREHSKIPMIIGGVGICHLFVDETADLERSLKVILNAKTQRPTVCNALDTILVHKAIAPVFIPRVVETLARAGVTFRADPKARKYAHLPLASPEDWDTEWLSLVLGIMVVDSLEEAILHIQAHSKGHSDGILTESTQNADRFVRKVHSAAVYVNTSTRFTDGGQFGLGAEVAISTQKLHARGPIGLKELTSYKWIVCSQYQVRT